MKIFFWILLAMTPITLIAQEQYMLAGTYTSGLSKGIYVYRFNTKDGSLLLVDSIHTANPSYLAVSPDNRFVYAVNELGNREGGGMVTSFSFDGKTGRLRELNSRSSKGNHPCFVSLDKTGKWLLVGNYSSGSAAVLPVLHDGSLGEAISVVQHEGSSINKKRQEGPHVHAAVLSPDNQFLYLPDLGIDKLVAYAFNESTGQITPSSNSVTIKDGSGPRHFEFHPNKKWAYLLNELSGEVTVFNVKDNKPEPVQTIGSLPESFNQPFTSADIHVSPDGRFVYASNRDESNTIAIFSVDQSNGRLSLVAHQSTLGKTPRNFSIDPTGNYLLVANQNSDSIIVFKIDKLTGLLKETGNQVRIGNPVCIKWAEASN